MGRYVDVNIYIGKKKIRITALILIGVVLFAAACIAVLVLIPGRGISTVSKGRELLANEKYIIHAGGFVTGEDGQQYSYTNSVEALNSCYDNGNRIAEFDLMITSDDEIVCAHDEAEEGGEGWAHGLPGVGDPVNPPTLEGFLGAKFMGSLTTMSLDELAAFMRQHSDLYVVTDVKDDNEEVCRRIRQDYPDLMRNFIIQIYHEDEYDRIKQLGFNNIIYTLYRADDSELEKDALLGFVNDTKLLAVTFWEDYPKQYEETFNALKETKVPLFAHTVNDRESMRRLLDQGVTGLYTDVVDREEREY